MSVHTTVYVDVNILYFCFRESALFAYLQASYSEIVEQLSPVDYSLDASEVPRGSLYKEKSSRTPRPIDLLELDNARDVIHSAIGQVEGVIAGLANQGIKIDGGLKVCAACF